MPTNLTKKYNQVLELLYLSEGQNIASIRKVFNRDIPGHPNFQLGGKPIYPTTAEGEDTMDRLFRHLTTVITDQANRKREFESERSVRLHWLRYHVDACGEIKPLVFNVPFENRIYLLDKKERYVVIFESLRDKTGYFLLTAYKLLPGNFKNLMTKYERRGVDGL